LLPLPVEIEAAGAPQRIMIKPTGRITVLRLPQARRSSAVRFDPDETVLKEVVATMR
jgi:hypothetical protein